MVAFDNPEAPRPAPANQTEAADAAWTAADAAGNAAWAAVNAAADAAAAGNAQRAWQYQEVMRAIAETRQSSTTRGAAV